MSNVDVLILGTGQAGVPLATRLASSGKKVAIIERGALGGTCVNDGCTPTKTMIASARAAHVARTATRLGVHARDVQVDFAAVVARKDAIVKRWRDSVEQRLRRPGIQLVHGHARFVAARTVEVGEDRITAPTVIINTGAHSTVPELAGLDSVPYLDSHRALELRDLPSHLLVLGGGYIGCELGQMFRRLGAEVTIVDRNPHLLAREDSDVSEALEAVFRNEGIRLELSANIERVARDAQGVSLSLQDAPTLRGSHLLLAVGRKPNTDDLGCQAAGIALDAHGQIAVDAHYRTSAEGVYAVGDVTDSPQFTHTSWDDHRLLFDQLQGRGTRTRADRLIPYVVFTDPQVAGVGLREHEAQERGLAYELASMPFGRIARAIETDETAGIMKLLIDPHSERVLGCHIVGLEAGELIHIFVALMQAGASVRAIVDAEAVHPSFAEGVQSLVMRLDRYKLS